MCCLLRMTEEKIETAKVKFLADRRPALAAAATTAAQP